MTTATETRRRQFAYYTDIELVRAANAPKLSTKTRLQMIDEINAREAETDAFEAGNAAWASGFAR